MATDLPRFTITLDESVLKQVVEYQDASGNATRSGAIQDLIRIGLQNQEDHGIIKKIKRPPTVSKDALAIARAYDRDLDDYGRALIRKVVAHERNRVEDAIIAQAPENTRTAEEDFADMAGAKE